MKTLASLLVLTLLLGPAAMAQSPAPRKAAPARSYPAWEQLSAAEKETLVAPIRERWNSSPGARARMMEHARRWQLMTPEQRGRAQRGMHRWHRMDPEQRAHSRVLYGDLGAMTPEQRRSLRAKWKTLTPEQRTHARALYGQMRGMTPQQRAALRAQWQTMTTDERDAWAEAHPAPKH